MKPTAFLVMFLLAFGAFGQDAANFDQKSANEAKAIIDQTVKEYNSYQSFQVNFILTVKQSGLQYVDTIKGYADGKKYRLSSKDQNIICDGETLWYHQIAENKVVQTTPDPQEANIIFPAEMLRIYEKNYIAQFAGEFPLGKKTLLKLEFFPKSSMEKFNKINVYVDKSTNQIIRVSRFGRDGSLYIMDLKDAVYNIKLASSLFKLQMS